MPICSELILNNELNAAFFPDKLYLRIFQIWDYSCRLDKCPEVPFLEFVGHFRSSELKTGHSQDIYKDATNPDRPCSYFKKKLNFSKTSNKKKHCMKSLFKTIQTFPNQKAGVNFINIQ